MKCTNCNTRPIRKIPNKKKKSKRVEVPAKVSGITKGFNYVYPSFPSKDSLCLQCFHYKESKEEFKPANDVDNRWSNIFKGDFA